MKRRVLVGSVPTPDGGELTLHRHGDDFHLAVDGDELMSSRAHGSEEELAELCLAPLRDRPSPRVLVGGLGMGYTLRAALDALAAGREVSAEPSQGSGRRVSPAPRPGPQNVPAETSRRVLRPEVVVAEFFPAVVEWNRGPLAHLAGRPLDDPRARVYLGDLADLLTGEPPDGPSWDAILLDLDTGPGAVTLERNRALYGPAGLARLHAALTPGGTLGVWSAHPDPAFLRRLREAGFDPRAHRTRARKGGKGWRHEIFVGRRV